MQSNAVHVAVIRVCFTKSSVTDQIKNAIVPHLSVLLLGESVYIVLIDLEIVNLMDKPRECIRWVPVRNTSSRICLHFTLPSKSVDKLWGRGEYGGGGGGGGKNKAY